MEFLPLEPRLLLAAFGVDPANLGKGDWIWRIADARASAGAATDAELFAYLRNKGMKWVAVKAADGTGTWSQFSSALVADAHAQGLKIFAWQYVYGANPSGEATAAKTAIARGADGFIIDAEGEYERLADNATAAATYCTSIRAAYPDLFLAHAPFPIVSYHSAFPYYTFGKYSDAVMPQDYWDAIGVTPARMNQWRNDEWNALYNGWKGTSKADAIKPIAPIAQGWNVSATNTLTAQEILDFASLMKATTSPASPGGYNGLSWWSVQHHTSTHWAAIGQVTVGAATFAPGQTVQVTATAGLKAWSDSSSASPATYTVKPLGAVATVVTGPVFAAGYWRWKLRYKGDAADTWSAQDWLAPAPAPAAPANAGPASGAMVYTSPVTLRWADVTVATSYDVYVNGALKGTTAGTQWAASALAPNAAHSWQVVARNSAGAKSSAVWSFSLNPIPGDANADGRVDAADARTVYAHLGKPGGWAAGDFTGDGQVTFADLQRLESRFGTTAPAAAPLPADPVATPEVLAGESQAVLGRRVGPVFAPGGRIGLVARPVLTPPRGR